MGLRARLFLPFLLLTVTGIVAVSAQNDADGLPDGSSDGSSDAPSALERPSDSVARPEAPEGTESLDVPDRLTGEEASPFLFDIKVGDVDVDLFWDGYWRFSFVVGTGFGVRTEETFFPGLARGAVFLQEPDVTLTLWLADRWFIETTFLQGFERNTYRGGYVGVPGDFVQSVIVGNAGVTARSFADIDVPDPRFNTPGISAAFETPKSRHEILLRYDPTEAQEKIFQGQYEVKTEEIGLPGFLEGRYFILPDSGVSDVVVWLEDSLGSVVGDDGRPYRRAVPAEYFVDLASGLVSLARPHDGRVVATYLNGLLNRVGVDTVANFVPIPDANLHPDVASGAFIPFDFTGSIDEYDPELRAFSVTSKVVLEGFDALILYDPGRFTPFERQNFYLTSRKMPQETWRIVPLLQDRGALYPAAPVNHRWSVDPDEKLLTAYSESTNLRDPTNRYPFSDADPEIYGVGRETDPSKVSRNILLAIREANTGYFLDTGLVKGSVVVNVNGVRDKTVEVTDQGTLVFRRFIFPDDWITATYRTEVLDLEGGDLYIYQGNRFDITPQLRFELAEEVRWNLSQQRSVTEADQSPGEIRIAGSMDLDTDRLDVAVRADGALRTPNTAGNFRLYGMEEGELGLVFSSEGLVPPPTTGVAATDPPPLAYVPLEEYNYISTNWLGQQQLNSYLWSGKSPVAGGEAPALAAVLSSDPVAGRVYEERFNLSAGEWTAGDYNPNPDGTIDLSSSTALKIYYRFIDPDTDAPPTGAAPPTVTMILGEIGQREDYDENGVIDAYDAGLVREWDLGTLSDAAPGGDWATDWSSGAWREISVTLTAADAARLTKVRGFRFLIENGSGSAMNGRLVVGQLSFDGSPFRTEVRTPPPANDLAAAQDVTANEITDNSLKTAYPETATLFHPGGESNRALLVRWGADIPNGLALAGIAGQPVTLADRWEAVSWFDGVPIQDYRTMVFYVKSTLAGEPLTATITDENDQGIVVNWTTPGTTDIWDRITVNIADGTASSDAGGTVTGVSIDSSAEELTRFVLRGIDESGNVGSRSGTLTMDEIYFRDPAFAFTGGAEIQAAWRYDEDLIAIGRFPVLGDITVDGRAVVDGGKVLSGIDRGNTVGTGDVSASADVLGVGLETAWRGSWGAGQDEWSGSHAIRIPARFPGFWVGDTYARGEGADGVTLSRGNDIGARFGEAGDLVLSTGALYDGNALTQTWRGSTGWGGTRWNTDLSIQYDLISDNAPTANNDYFQSWIEDYRLILPADENVTNREGHHILGISTEFGPVEVKWDPALRFKASQTPLWNQENRWVSLFSVPIKLGQDGDWKITSSYKRDLRQTIDTEATGLNDSFSDSWTVLSNGLGRQFPLITFVPFRELFGTEDATIFADTSRGMAASHYETEFILAMERPTGSRIIDLFIPGTTDLSFKRNYDRRGDIVGWENDWNFSLTLTALNMFGRFGRWPWINLYNSEEFTNYFYFRLRDFNGAPTPDPEEFTWQSYFVFTGNRRRQLTLDNSLTWNWDESSITQQGRLEYIWRTKTFEQLKLPLVKRVIPREHYLESKERLSVNGLYPMKNAPAETLFDLAFTLYHETRWVFRDRGHLKGWLAVGLGSQDEVFTNGVEFGLEVEIRF